MLIVQKVKIDDPVPSNYKSAVIESFQHRPPTAAVQLYEQVGDEQLKVDAVGRPLPHVSAEKHTTGEAVYTDDMPALRGYWLML